MKVALINPSNTTAGFALMTPRWMPVLAAATPHSLSRDIRLIDQAVEDLRRKDLESMDLIGLSIHTLNAHRAYRLIQEIKQCSRAKIVAGGAHTTLFPQEVLGQGADAVVTGDADIVWEQVLADANEGRLQQLYVGGRTAGSTFIAKPRWDLLKCERYLMATVHTTKGCPENCSFCSVWRTDGRTMRLRNHEDIVGEICELHARGFRFIVLADDNFFALGSGNQHEQERLLADRYALMEALEHRTPADVVFLTQTSIRTAQNPKFLDAMRRAKVRLALVGIESVNAAALRKIGKNFNRVGDELVSAIQTMQAHGVYVLGSHIIGLPSDTPKTYREMIGLVRRSDMFLAQFVRYTLFPGTVDFERAIRGKSEMTLAAPRFEYWLDGFECTDLLRHPTMAAVEIDRITAGLWAEFYSIPEILRRAHRFGLRRPKHLAGYLLLCRLFRKVYFQYGAATDSARTHRASWLARLQGRLLLSLGKRRPRPLPFDFQS